MWISKAIRRVPVSTALFLLAVILPSTVPADGGQGEAWVIERPHSLVYYSSKDDEKAARRVASIIERRMPRIAETLGVEGSPGKPTVVLHHGRQEFLREARPGRHGVIGLVSGERRVIDLDAAARAPLEQLVTHELVHYMLARRLGGRINALPRWVNEGLAQDLSRTWTVQDQRVVSSAARDGQLFPISSLDSALADEEADTELAYAESFALVRLIAVDHGGIMGDVLSDIEKGASFSEAFEAATGSSIPELQERFVESLGKESTWTERVLRIAGVLSFWTVMAVVLVAAVVAFVRRRRRQFEALEDYEDDYAEEEGGGDSPY